MNNSNALTLLREAITSVAEAVDGDRNLPEALDSFCSTDLAANIISRPQSSIPDHHDLLNRAINEISNAQFATLKSALSAAKDELHWKIDDGGYYKIGADVGEGYKSGNMHALLIGPENALIESKDFLLGLFLLAPWTLYRDHKHRAPEIYIPLTGPSGWRFELGAWEDHPAGSKIINAPEVVHATRVYETPFLAIFAWTHDIDCICSVVDTDDWQEIEEQLERNH